MKKKQLKKQLKQIESDIKIYSMKLVISKADLDRSVFLLERMKEEQLSILKSLLANN